MRVKNSFSVIPLVVKVIQLVFNVCHLFVFLLALSSIHKLVLKSLGVRRQTAPNRQRPNTPKAPNTRSQSKNRSIRRKYQLWR